jgi:hypothetical protein
MLGLLFLAERTIRESVAQGFEIVALGAFPASMASIGSQLAARRGARARARLWRGSNAARKAKRTPLKSGRCENT